MPARPQAPPLVTMPSTPGPEVPGGYPRNSAVFATNQWADSNVGATAPSTFLAAAKTYLPAGVASYFPDVPPKHPTPSVTPSPGVHTPYPRDVPPVLNTDGTVTSVSFSTRAYAGSRSSRQEEPGSPGAESNFTYVRTPGEEVPMPMPEEEVVLPPPEHVGDATEAEAPAVPRPRATSGLKPSHPGVADSSHPPLTHTESHLPLPVDIVSAPPFAPAAPSPATSAGTTPSTAPSSPPLATPPPSSPASLSPSPKSPKLLSKFKSLRRPVDKAAAATGPPSAFHARGGSVDVGRSVEAVNVTRGAGASLDSASPSPASPSASQASPASRKKSLLRTLRGEAKVLTGKVRRDQGKVEEGRRLLL